MNDKCNNFSYIDLYTYLCTTFKKEKKKKMKVLFYVTFIVTHLYRNEV